MNDVGNAYVECPRNTARRYAILDEKGSEKGAYRAKTSLQAAKRAFVGLCRETNLTPPFEMRFVMIDIDTKTTQTYKGIREELLNPQVLRRGDETIFIRYLNKVSKI